MLPTISLPMKNVLSLLFASMLASIAHSDSSSSDDSQSVMFSHLIEKRAAYSHWTYEDQKEWLTLNYSYCGGDRQSPINLDSSTAVVDKTLHLDINSYDKLLDPEVGMVLANGHSLRMDVKSPGTYTLTGSAVDDKVYQLVQLHVHWGINTMAGSEHAIDGERFAAEVHFVHVNSKYGSSTKSAVSNPDGLAVLGVIAKNGDPNPGLDTLLEAMESNRSGQEHRLKSTFNMHHFLPRNVKSYFKYSGSLTTPNCEEVVNWIVMKDQITVSNEQMDRLRSLEDHSGYEMKTVIRDLQPVKGRTVLQSDSSSSIQPLKLIYFMILMTIVHFTFIQKPFC